LTTRGPIEHDRWTLKVKAFRHDRSERFVNWLQKLSSSWRAWQEAVEQGNWESNACERAVIFWRNTCLREAMAGWRAGVARKQYGRELARQALLVLLRSSLLKVNSLMWLLS
jgi:hypothetical protein